METKVADMLSDLLSDGPVHKRAIRMFEFQTWIYFPNDREMLEAAGRLAAAAYVRKYELDNVERASDNPRSGIDSKTLRALLSDPYYKSLYDNYFQVGGWTSLARMFSTRQFNSKVEERKRTVETVCEMIDFRFRGLDHHVALPTQSFNISRGEYYRFHEHPGGKLSWKTIRSRWQNNRESSPLLYVNEKFGGVGLPWFDLKKPTFVFEKALKSRAALRKFIGMSFYVAEKLEKKGVVDSLNIRTLKIGKIRPPTEALSNDVLAKMESYKQNRDAMKNS